MEVAISKQLSMVLLLFSFTQEHIARQAVGE
jgi:hypothetical protein